MQIHLQAKLEHNALSLRTEGECLCERLRLCRKRQARVAEDTNLMAGLLDVGLFGDCPAASQPASQRSLLRWWQHASEKTRHVKLLVFRTKSNTPNNELFHQNSSLLCGEYGTSRPYKLIWWTMGKLKQRWADCSGQDAESLKTQSYRQYKTTTSGITADYILLPRPHRLFNVPSSHH